MDGAGDIYNYIRLGGDFDTVANNMNELKHVDKQKEEGELIKKNKKRLTRWGEKKEKGG